MEEMNLEKSFDIHLAICLQLSPWIHTQKKLSGKLFDRDKVTSEVPKQVGAYNLLLYCIILHIFVCLFFSFLNVVPYLALCGQQMKNFIA